MESTATTNVDSHSVGSKRLARFCTRGVTFGVLSYLVGYLLVAALFVVGPASIEQGADLDIKLKWFGFVFYNAHFIPIAVGSQPYNFITQATNPAVPALVYQAIPVVTLGAASAAFASFDTLDEPLESIVYSGASIAIGYVVMAVLGALLLTIPFLGITAQPDVTKSAIFGAAYPVVIATVVTIATTFARQ